MHLEKLGRGTRVGSVLRLYHTHSELAKKQWSPDPTNK